MLGRWITFKPKNKQDISNILRNATEVGVLESNTLSMLEGVLDVQETRVADVMIPRMQMVTLDAEMDLQSILARVVQSGHSRFPVLGENKDEVLGIILAKDLLNYTVSQAHTFSIEDVIRKTVFIPESKRLNLLLQDFRMNRSHMAIVVDEYGRNTGLITVEDVLEKIVGEIADEYDTDDTPNIRAQKNGDYSVKALTTIEEFNEYFNCELAMENVETIGGLVTRTFGHLPKRGECIKIEDFYFTVLRADTRRIHILSVIREVDNQLEPKIN